MNIVLAQMKKDSVPVYGMLVAAVVVIASAVTYWIVKAAGAPVSFSGNLPQGILYILLIVLAVRVIHQDSLTDPSAFWRTRPISRSQLLLAKAGLLLPLFVVATIVGRPWSDASKSGSYLDFCFILLGFAAYASVTSRFSEMIALFLKVCLSLFIVGATVAIVTVPVYSLWTYFSVDSKPPTFEMLSGPWLYLPPIIQCVVLAGLLFVIVFQFLTLKSETSIRFIYVFTNLGFVASWLAERLPASQA